MPFIGHIGVCSSTGRTFDFAGPFTVNEDRLLFGKPTRYVVLNPEQATKPSGRRGAAVAGPPPDSSSPPALCRQRGDLESSGPAPEHDVAGRLGAHIDVWAEGGSGGGGGSGGMPGGGTAGGATVAAHSWDHRLGFAATTYRLLNYNIMTNNCHCFVAHFLNQLAFRGGGWDMVNLAAFVFVRGRYTSLAGLVYTWLPWLLLVSLGGYFGRLAFACAYAALCAPLLAWFLLYTWCCWRDLSF